MKYKIKDLLSSIVDNRGKTPPLANDGYVLIEINAIASKKKNPDYSVIKKRVSKEVYDSWFRSGHPQKGDILIPTVGTLDAIAYMDRNDCCIAQNLISFRTNPKICNSEYLFYLLCDPNIRKKLLNLDIGGVQPSIKVPHLKDLEVDIPSLNIQHKIATVLSSLDNKIAVNTVINENLEQQAQALSDKWVAEHLDCISMRPLVEVAEINPDTYSPKDKWAFVNYLDTSSITNGIISDIQLINPDTEKLPSRARRIIKANDIVYSTVRPNQLHFGIISNPLDNMLASTGFAVIRSKYDYISSPYIYHFLISPDFIEKMQQLAEQSTSTFPSVKPSDIGTCLIPCADETEMLDISDKINGMYAMVSANRQENKRLADLRDTLLPKLMNGEIDVSVVKI